MNEHIGKLFGWLKTYWHIFLLVVLSASFYWVLWLNLYAIVVSIALIAVLVVFRKGTLVTVRRYWPVIAIIVIISLLNIF